MLRVYMTEDEAFIAMQALRWYIQHCEDETMDLFADEANSVLRSIEEQFRREADFSYQKTISSIRRKKDVSNEKN